MSWDRDWSVEPWLEALGLGCYTESFLDNGYDLQELCANLKTEDLDAIGVKDEMHRARIFAEASKLRDEARARFKKSNGGGSSGSTDHSGSLGSRSSFPAYSEPWSEDPQLQKHVYSDVWEQQMSSPTDGGGMTPALAQLMSVPNGGSEKNKGHTFPPVVPPSKVPRKKVPTSPGPAGPQVLFTLPAAPRAAPGSGISGGGGLNKLQLKLKVLEELQRDRIILSESPYCNEDGSMDEVRVSELCQTYSERFSIEPSQIMDTMRVICRAADPKAPEEEHDGTNLTVKNPPLLSTSDNYEEPLDVMKDDRSTFKDPVSPSSPLKKSPPKKGGSPQFLQKPRPSSCDSSPGQKRQSGSPRSSPHVSPSTSPKEHKKFGFFSKKTKKKPVRSNSVKEGGKAGKAVLLPGKSNEEGAVVATASPLSSKRRPARPSLSFNSSPSSPPSATGNKTSGKKHRTVSISSTSTTGSETSPLAPKKYGIMRFSEQSPRLQRKAKTVGRGKGTLESSPLTASDMALDRVGLRSEPEIPGEERLRGAQSHKDLLNTQTSPESPATRERRTVESKEKSRGLLGLLKRKTVGGKRGRKGKERREKEEEEGEREEGGEEEEKGGEGPSFLTASMSLPNIAVVAAQLGDNVSTPSPLATPTHQTPSDSKKSSTVPPKPSHRTRLQPLPPPSPDTSPLPQRKVQQSTGDSPGDYLIPIQDGGPGGERGDKITSWHPVSPSHLLLNSPRGFELDVFASTASHEGVADFGESSQRNSLRDSVTSYTSTVSDGVVRSGDVASSVGSESSLVFTSSTSSVSLAKTSSAGSVKKPPPPPKPKSLERGKATRGGRGSLSRDPQPISPPEGKRKEVGANSRTNERVVPPKKPPRTNRGSVKLSFAVEIDKKTERGQAEAGGGGGRVESAVPPPKPARRHKSMKTTTVDQDPVETARRKSQTMQHPRSGASHTSSVMQGAPTGGSTVAAPRKPVPAPKPRSSLSQKPAAKSPSPPTLRESITARLTEEGIDLTIPPFSTMWGGEWGVPALLVSRYARALDQPSEQIALLMDDIRIQNLKDKSREFTPMKMTDCMRHSSVSTDSVANFLTSIGLPMYTSLLTRSRGFFNIPSLQSLNDKRMEELGIALDHRGILMEQIRLTK